MQDLYRKPTTAALPQMLFVLSLCPPDRLSWPSLFIVPLLCALCTRLPLSGPLLALHCCSRGCVLASALCWASARRCVRGEGRWPSATGKPGRPRCAMCSGAVQPLCTTLCVSFHPVAAADAVCSLCCVCTVLRPLDCCAAVQRAVRMSDFDAPAGGAGGANAYEANKEGQEKTTTTAAGATKNAAAGASGTATTSAAAAAPVSPTASPSKSIGGGGEEDNTTAGAGSSSSVGTVSVSPPVSFLSPAELAALERETEQLTQSEVETLLAFLADYYTIDLVRLSGPKDATKDPNLLAQQQTIVGDILRVEGCAQCLVAHTYDQDEAGRVADADKTPEARNTTRVANDAFILLGCKLLHCKHVVHVLCVLKLQAKLRAAAASGTVSKMILPTLDLCHSTSFFRVIAFPIGTQSEHTHTHTNTTRNTLCARVGLSISLGLVVRSPQMPSLFSRIGKCPLLTVKTPKFGDGRFQLALRFFAGHWVRWLFFVFCFLLSYYLFIYILVFRFSSCFSRRIWFALLLFFVLCVR